jgi:acetyl-CoA carboxylase carboxyltransferase component
VFPRPRSVARIALQPCRRAAPSAWFAAATHSSRSPCVLFPDSSYEAARFIWTCNAYNLPLIFMVEIAGYMSGSEVEKQSILGYGAKMLFAVAESRVPRIAGSSARPIPSSSGAGRR